MPAFTVRPFSTMNLENALEVYRQCEDFLALGPQPQASLEMVRADWKHSQQEGGLFCGIYLPEDRLVGILDYVLGSYEGRPEQAFLSLLMIAAPHRSRGLGRAVVEWLETSALQGGVEVLLSAVQVNNPAAIRFWQKMGFQVEGGPILQPNGTTVFMLNKAMT